MKLTLNKHQVFYQIIEKTIKTIAAIILFVIVFVRCDDAVQEIDWETVNIPNKLIVDGNITNQLSRHPIKLTRSDDYFANVAERMVSGATVIISSESGDIIYAENISKPGFYEALEEYSGEISMNYKLKIDLPESIDGTDYYEAETKIIEGMRVDSVQAYLYNNPTPTNSEDSIWLIAVLYGLDPAQIENYYMAKLYRNGEIVTDTVQNFTHFCDADYDFNGETIFYIVYTNQFLPTDTFGIDLISIPKDYEYFLTGLGQLSEPEDVFGFSGPRANVVGNINNGTGLGFFYSGYVQSGQSLVIDATY